MPPRLLKYMFDTMIHAIAVVVAAVLTDPAVKEAIANIIVTGVTNFVRQPNLDEHLLFANQTLGRTRDTVANKAGQDFPKVVGAFVKGMFQLTTPQQIEASSSDAGSDKEKDKPEQEQSTDKKEASTMTNSNKSNLVKPEEEEDETTTASSDDGEDTFRLPSIPTIAAK